MQYIEGQTLRHVLGGRPLELDSLLSIALQIADAISTAHAQSIIHRDIKPGNIVVSARGQAKVLDFGLAKLLEPDSDQADAHLTLTNAVMGTPTGMSPEQARGERVDHRSDIFSFGIVLYEMATGSVPFTGRSVADVISAVLKEHPKPANEVNKKIPEQLSRIIERALAKEPVARYQSMSEVVTDLRLLIKQAGALDRLFDSKGGQLPVVPRELKRPQSRRVLISILALSGLILVVLAMALAISRRATPEPAKQIESIAVLPFKPLVPETRDEALEMGMSDTLIARLGNIHQIKVRPISSVRKYAGLEQDALTAGREQKVEVVLDGSIQKAADDVRVTVRLLRVADGQQLWTETFNEKFTNIFVVQDRVAEKVVNLLTVKLAGQEQTLLTRRDTNDG
jgi:serine/threonine-protein kinase